MSLDYILIQKELDTLTKGVSVQWDRYVYDEELMVFGWISRTDGQRDFIIVIFRENETRYYTSSAKYSKLFSENWEIPHTSCRKWKGVEDDE